MAKLVTRVELGRDGSRTVYHRAADPGKPGFVWTHPDTKEDRASCSACTSGTLDSVRRAPR